MWAPYIKPKGIALDVGAHFGYISKELAALKTHELDIIAFERLSIAIGFWSVSSQRRSHIKVERFTLSDQNGAVDISIPVKKSGRMGIGLSHIGAENNRDYIIEPVQVSKIR